MSDPSHTPGDSGDQPTATAGDESRSGGRGRERGSGGRSGGRLAGLAARLPAVEVLLPVVCVLAGLLLVGSELLDTFTIENPEGEAIATIGAADRHSFAFGLLGLLAIAGTVIAVLASSRPAAVGVAAVGLIALILFVIIDLPDAGASDLILERDDAFTEGRAVAGGGFWISLIGAITLSIAGTLLATLSPTQLGRLQSSQDRPRPARDRSSAKTSRPNEKETRP